jgi:large subunit ribosomal protein L15
MQIHQLKPIHKNPARKRVGRGGKRGTYSGRGQKGQKSRAGRKLAPVIRELIKRYPKLRGYRAERFLQDTEVINIEVLEKRFNAEETINPKILLEKGLIRRIGGRAPIVKVLGKGKITKKFNFESCQFSKQAKEKIEKAGGTIK